MAKNNRRCCECECMIELPLKKTLNQPSWRRSGQAININSYRLHTQIHITHTVGMTLCKEVEVMHVPNPMTTQSNGFLNCVVCHKLSCKPDPCDWCSQLSRVSTPCAIDWNDVRARAGHPRPVPAADDCPHDDNPGRSSCLPHIVSCAAEAHSHVREQW